MVNPCSATIVYTSKPGSALAVGFAWFGCVNCCACERLKIIKEKKMTNKFIIIATLVVMIGGICVIAWENVVATNTWNTSMGGNYKCNESVLSPDCVMLENKELKGMYEGLTFIGNVND